MKNPLETMKSLTFGIEIELTGITREKAAKVVAKHFGTTHRYIGGCYKAYLVEDNQGREWTVERDSSIEPERKYHGEVRCASDDFRTEFVSPILRYDDIPELQELVRELRHGGALANSSCGIHIHVGAKPFTPQTLRNLVNNMAAKDDILYDALKVKAGRAHTYCKKTEEWFIEAVNTKKPKTMNELRDIWYSKYPWGTHQHYHNSRYHGLNLHSDFTKGTVEFRLFNSTTHAGEIKSYIQFVLALAAQALNQKRSNPQKSSRVNDKYMFRCWLLRLGMIGDEFKTARYHLLKNLTGNAARSVAA